MMGTKRRASRDMARMDGKHFSLDSVLTVLSFLILVVVVVIPMVMIVYNTFFYEGKFDTSLFTQIILDPGNVAAMWNTIKIALLVTLFGTIMCPPKRCGRLPASYSPETRICPTYTPFRIRCGFFRSRRIWRAATTLRRRARMPRKTTLFP